MNRSYWQGHILQFEARPAVAYSTATGFKLLLIVLIMEVILGPRLALAELLGLPMPSAILRIALLFILALVLLRFYAGIKMADVGLHSWKNWSTTERWYFVQTIVLANLVFAMMMLPRVKAILGQQDLWMPALGVLVTQLLWGLYQELIYRGILQTELVRRWGHWTGIIVTNALFTFGPLHFYHFRAISENPSFAWIFAAIFAIGLFFGLLFQRSGNLWIVGILHGIGDWYISGIPQVTSGN